ncbi:sensor histidine kinase [Streptosporangium sp. NPDC050855]|uniref:sensor histidine kinase n=1 Tax=Streptosporangium sp. NPDC050855 TaxID=3366194 RepID=UPI0037ABD2C9
MSKPPRPWSRAWRYLLATVVGMAAWGAMTAVVLSEPLTAAQEDVVGAVLVLDLALGAVTLALLPLRRRRPLVVACLVSAACAVSVTSMGTTALAVASMATRRRRSQVAIVAAVFLAGSIVSELLYRPRFHLTEGGGPEAASGIVLGGAFFAAAVATGYYIAARRELVDSLRERALTVEREQALTAKIARDAERTRIAREMHDVLAHRISLVALHAGALTYRENLGREQTARTAETIQDNAQLALAELRDVLGVLRADGPVDVAVERPQSTLAELPALLADAREAGSAVRLDSGEVLTSHLPETLSGTAFRIVQEALTNARKHAPGEPVVVRLAGTTGSVLEVEVRNLLGDRAPGDPPSPGVGLLGLAERVELAGGTFFHGPRPDGSFVVTVRLPWPS